MSWPPGTGRSLVGINLASLLRSLAGVYVEGCLPGHGSAWVELVKRAMADTAVEREVTSMLIDFGGVDCTDIRKG